MIADDYVSGEVDVMSVVWWRIAYHCDLTKRYRSSEIPGHPLIAFADEFTSRLTLTDAFLGMFSIVISGGGPDVWLAPRLTRLTDRIATPRYSSNTN